MSSNEFIALIRCAPETDEATRLRRWLKRQDSAGSLFFQASGVEHAALTAPFGQLDTGQFSLRVCEGSWRRRFEHDPPEPFSIGSLIELFSKIDDGLRLECFGADA